MAGNWFTVFKGPQDQGEYGLYRKRTAHTVRLNDYMAEIFLSLLQRVLNGVVLHVPKIKQYRMLDQKNIPSL